MKHTSLIVTVLAAAALGAVAVPAPRAQPGPAPASAPATYAHVHGADLEQDDPHTGLYTGVDPHAALYGADDPHAALHLGDAPHQAVHGAGSPHAGPHGGHAHGDPHGAAAPHATRAPGAVPSAVERSRAGNGRTVAEIFEQRAALAGSRVTLRATVVKATDGVLGKTYLHLQDGSGSAQLETHDLTATTTERFELDETVEVEGLLAIDQDVGLDYRYPALLQDVQRAR